MKQLQKVKAELGELSNNPQGLLLEAIHSAGYAGALALPLLATEAALNRLDVPGLEKFVAVRSVILSDTTLIPPVLIYATFITFFHFFFLPFPPYCSI